jgi:hypothetical protein
MVETEHRVALVAVVVQQVTQLEVVLLELLDKVLLVEMQMDKQVHFQVQAVEAALVVLVLLVMRVLTVVLV